MLTKVGDMNDFPLEHSPKHHSASAGLRCYHSATWQHVITMGATYNPQDLVIAIVIDQTRPCSSLVCGPVPLCVVTPA